jgi:hypothetical protein
LFWENGKAVLENWWVCLYGSIERVEKKIPIPTIDTGDMFRK